MAIGKLLPLLLSTRNRRADLVWLHVWITCPQTFPQPIKSSIKILEFSW